jgi:hypothetical protein
MVDRLWAFLCFPRIKKRVVRTSLAKRVLSSNSLMTTTTGLDRRNSFVLDGRSMSFYGLVNKISSLISKDMFQGRSCQLIQVNIYRG